MSKSYFIDAARLEMKLQGFDGLACDPDAYECSGCSLDNISPDDCLNPDCYGAHWTDPDAAWYAACAITLLASLLLTGWLAVTHMTGG